MSTPDVTNRRQQFRALHASGCFVLPNPWDIGSARYLQHAGFAALASTSSGRAWSRGLPDGGETLDEVLAHLRELVAATSLPLNADFGDGFGAASADVEVAVRRAIDTGVAGLSIEDASGDPGQPLRPLDDAVARLRAARKAIDRSGAVVMLTGRAENFFVGQPDIEDAIRRLRAYAAAGADCLYAPGITQRAHIEAVVAAVAPKPVNLLIGGPSAFSLQEIAAMGVRRVSLGGALARAAWGGVMRATQLLQDEGSFAGLEGAAPGATLNALFDPAKR
ncbi:isocitrate lyase/phosphoenolpyruvate mutase family protein [Stenotrophomonas sp. CFBP 13725]|uniref:isocitrate lyase/PEP mutase family protein n=1 Tax=Stenotrophomonas sp. CFBP 13725 TaxID=2775297 RepID=UPI0017825DE2|nr:isocitrate lyase/phosphoenolpyruvate mutase family protein [Stenotrophomonas sp. CFBP 13725]MBD8636347.1 isocitrate lyase/phosphoenolpyruvate mutase family protein [Stenotrophomonas sp. CFBP 13725]